MGLLDLFSKKKKVPSSGKEFNIPPPPSDMHGDVESTISFEDVLPPPRGFDEEQTEPHRIEDIEIPQVHEESAADMPEFPDVPQEEQLESLDVPLPEEEPLEQEAQEPAHEEMENLELPPLEEYHEEAPASEEYHTAPEETPLSEPEEPAHVREKKGPIFVDLPNYASVLGAIETVKGNLRDCSGALSNTVAAKNLEDSRLEAWHSALENLQRKLLYVDRSLFEKGE